MYWIGWTLVLSSGLFSLALVRSFIRKYFRKYCHDINDGAFDTIVIIMLIIGLSITANEYCSDQNEIKLLKLQDISLYNAMGNKSGKWNTIPCVGTPINDWNKQYAHYEDGQIIFD